MERSQVPERYKWDTSVLFESDEAWERAFAALEKKADFSRFRGTLKDADSVLAYFEADAEFGAEAMLVYLYVYMKHDEDVRVTKYNSDVQRVVTLLTKVAAETAFATPELTALPEETLDRIASDEKLKAYDYMLSRIKAAKAHTLGEKEEAILAQAADPLGVAGDVFEMLDNAELALPEIEFGGEKQKLTHGLYSVIMSGKDRKKRAEAFKAYYAAYGSIANTLATTYYGNVKKDIFYRTARGYKSCLDMALFEEDVDESVYRNLVECVNGRTAALHRYMRLRKQTLGYEEMHMYDVYPSMVEDAELRLPFDEAFGLVVKGLSPLGEEYAALLRRAKEERWIDVEETEGKRGGAYSIGVYGAHPYVLLNYRQTTQDVFAIAHELGHAMHSHFSCSAQPYAKSEYKIFVAEVASTVNEVLLLKYLLKTSEDARLKKYLLNYYMDMIRTTLYRQTQFAEFEERAHAMAEEGRPLNKDNLSELYYDLNKKYYGDAVTHDGEIALEWARVPHFYRSFYVYKYATGITSAIAIADKILGGEKDAVKHYFDFLKGGSSADPVTLLKRAGADLTKKETFEEALDEFERTLEAFGKTV